MLQQPLFLPLCLSDLPSGLPPPSVDPSAAPSLALSPSLALLWLFASSITRQRGKREREREAASYTKAAPLPPPFFPSLLPSMLSVGRSVGLLFLCSKQPFTSGAALYKVRGGLGSEIGRERGYWPWHPRSNRVHECSLALLSLPLPLRLVVFALHATSGRRMEEEMGWRRRRRH